MIRRVCLLMGLLAGEPAERAFSAAPAPAPTPSVPMLPAAPAAATEPVSLDDPIAVRSLGGGCVLIQRLRGPAIILAPERRGPSAGVPGVLQLAVLVRPERDSVAEPRSEFVEVHRLAAVGGSPELAAEHILPGDRDGRATVAGFRVSHRAIGRATLVECDGLRLLYLGDPAAVLSDAAVAELAGVDVLILPLPGGLDWPSETIAKLAVRQVILPVPTESHPDQRKAWSAAVGRRPMGELVGSLILLQRRSPVWPELLVGLPAAVVWLSDGAASGGAASGGTASGGAASGGADSGGADSGGLAGPLPEWSAELTPLRAARAEVWAQLRGVGAAPLDARDRLGEMPARYHAEHAVGRDLTDLTRLVARPRGEWLPSLEWDTRPGPAGFAARSAGLSGRALVGLSARAARWAEELLLTEQAGAAATEAAAEDRQRVLTALEWSWRHRGEQIQRRLSVPKPETPKPETPKPESPK